MSGQVNVTKRLKHRTSVFPVNIDSGRVFEGLVYVQYVDHVVFHHTVAETQMLQVREVVGWLKYDCATYVIICYDRDAGPPTLKGGDPKASGVVLLKAAILEFKKLPLQQNSKYILNSTVPMGVLSMRLNQKAKNSQPITHRRHK